VLQIFIDDDGMTMMTMMCLQWLLGLWGIPLICLEKKNASPRFFFAIYALIAHIIASMQ